MLITLFIHLAITDMLPTILNQLPTESLAHLKERIVGASASAQGGAASVVNPAAEEDDEVPELVENFDEPSKKEASTVDAKAADEVKPAPADEAKAAVEVKPAEEAAAAAAPVASEPVKAAEAPKTEE